MFERAAFCVMSFVAALAIAAIPVVHFHDAEQIKRLTGERDLARVETKAWLEAIKKLSEKVDPHPSPSPRRPGQIGDAPPK